MSASKPSNPKRWIRIFLRVYHTIETARIIRDIERIIKQMIHSQEVLRSFQNPTDEFESFTRVYHTIETSLESSETSNEPSSRWFIVKKFFEAYKTEQTEFESFRLLITQSKQRSLFVPDIMTLLTSLITVSSALSFCWHAIEDLIGDSIEGGGGGYTTSLSYPSFFSSSLPICSLFLSFSLSLSFPLSPSFSSCVDLRFILKPPLNWFVACIYLLFLYIYTTLDRPITYKLFLD